MNNRQQLRIALIDRLHHFDLNQPDKPQQSQPNPKSHRKASPSLQYKRLSVYSKEKNLIPSVKQARYREKQIKYYHNRTFYKRKSQLEDIFKQNMRLYQQLNKQKSYYEINFKSEKIQKKAKKAHSVSCTENYATKYIEMDKVEGEDGFENRTPLERRFSFSVGRSCKNGGYLRDKSRENDQKSTGGMIRPQSDFAINIKKRYQKNKTEMLPRKNRLQIQKSSELASAKQFNSNIQPATNNVEALAIILPNQKMFTATKNPGYMRMKRRPSSGFRA